MPKFFVDLSPLSVSRDFRLLFVGQLISGLGDQVTIVAVGYEVYRVTHSSLQVGLVSLVQLIPLLTISLLGGPYIDRVDRRKLLIWSFFGSLLVSSGLAIDAFASHPLLWPFYIFTAVEAGLSGITKPAQNAAIPQMVPPEKLTAAFGVRQIMFQVGTVVGPSLAGIIIATLSSGYALSFDAFSFGIGLLASLMISKQPPPQKATTRGLDSLLEGLRYVRSSQALQGVFLIDLSAMVFGMPRALFPALALAHFHRGATALGLLYSAVGAGSMVAALTSGWLNHLRHQGRWVIGAVMLWGGSITVFGVLPSLYVALCMLGVAGYADVVSAVLRASMLQHISPPQMRGRMAAMQIAVVTGGPRIGDLESGLGASLLGTIGSVTSGGVACIVGALVIWRWLPRFAHYQLPETPTQT